jgi:hypothetical protein
MVTACEDGDNTPPPSSPTELQPELEQTPCVEPEIPPTVTPEPTEPIETTPPETSPSPEPSPIPTPRPKSQWEIDYGEEIARQAHILLNNADNYYIWGAHDGELYIDPPPRRPPQPGETWWNYGVEIDLHQRVNDRTPIVCADVIALSYKNAGLDLEQTYPDWFAGGDYDATRNVPMLGVLLRDFNQEYLLDNGTLPELGDMVLRGENYLHSSVVAEITGDDASQIFVIEASYPNDTIRKVSLVEWAGVVVTHFGHPKVPGR